MENLAASSLLLALVIVSFAGECFGQLEFDFYNGKCNGKDVESIAASILKKSITDDPTLAPAFIRMQFHDCFVNGCDASLLLVGNKSEQTAPPNLSVRGYEVIEDIKVALEQACKGVVSCADIIVMAARESVFLSKGGRYEIQTGRKDGFISKASLTSDLPSPRSTVIQSEAAFLKKGLNITDMVLLLGGHTVGITHCANFEDRLYNFQKTGKADPTMHPTLLQDLKKKCPQNSGNTVALDQNPSSANDVDNSFYKQIIGRRGVLQIDQELALDDQTKDIVSGIATSSDFLARFGQAMVKLGGVGVTGDGEIRDTCGKCKNLLRCAIGAV